MEIGGRAGATGGQNCLMRQFHQRFGRPDERQDMLSAAFEITDRVRFYEGSFYSPIYRQEHPPATRQILD